MRSKTPDLKRPNYIYFVSLISNALSHYSTVLRFLISLISNAFSQYSKVLASEPDTKMKLDKKMRLSRPIPNRILVKLITPSGFCIWCPFSFAIWLWFSKH